MPDWTVRVDADVRDLERGMDRGRRSTQDFTRRSTEGLRRLATASTIAFGAITAGLGAYSRATLRIVDDEAKAARSAGVAFDAYQELAFVFDLAGIGGTKFQRVVQQVSQATALAGEGLSSYVRALAFLGVTYEDVARLTPVERTLFLLDAARQQEDVARRQAAAQILFGVGARDLGTILSENNQTIQRQRELLRSYGGVMSEDVARVVEQLDDDLTLVSRVMRTRFTTAVVESGMALGLFEGKDELIRSLGEAAGTAGEGFTTWLADLKEILETMDAIGQWLNDNSYILRTGIGGLLTGDREGQPAPPAPGTRITIDRGGDNAFDRDYRRNIAYQDFLREQRELTQQRQIIRDLLQQERDSLRGVTPINYQEVLTPFGEDFVFGAVGALNAAAAGADFRTVALLFFSNLTNSFLQEAAATFAANFIPGASEVIPVLHSGGPVRQTGLHLLEEGEYVQSRQDVQSGGGRSVTVNYSPRIIGSGQTVRDIRRDAPVVSEILRRGAGSPDASRGPRRSRDL